jgi:hypothetical protein
MNRARWISRLNVRLALAALLLVLAACGSVTGPEPIDPAPALTGCARTMAEVAAKRGEPSRITTTPFTDGRTYEVWAYTALRLHVVFLWGDLAAPCLLHESAEYMEGHHG